MKRGSIGSAFSVGVIGRYPAGISYCHSLLIIQSNSLKCFFKSAFFALIDTVIKYYAAFAYQPSSYANQAQKL